MCSDLDTDTCDDCSSGSFDFANDGVDSDGDGTCDASLCAQDQRVLNNTCVACPAGSTNAAGDNVTGADTTCDTPACDDGLQNGDETDIDCGGSCNECDVGEGCVDNSDCSSICEDGVCSNP